MPQNPYTVLGISKDATDEEIKLAHRRAVKSCHPDQGGDPKLFAAVQAAVELLRDPEQRKLFDETGGFRTQTEWQIDAQVFQVIAMITEQVFANPAIDFDKMDICALMNAQIAELLMQARRQEREFALQLAKTEKMLQRLKRNKPRGKKAQTEQGMNMLEMVLNGRRENIDRTVAKLKTEIGTMVRAQDHLAEFGYDFPQAKLWASLGNSSSDW